MEGVKTGKAYGIIDRNPGFILEQLKIREY